jgi:hypothetical protein
LNEFCVRFRMRRRGRTLEKCVLVLVVLTVAYWLLLALSRRKIDWHDYKYMEYEAGRRGLGEQGESAVLTMVDSELKQLIFDANGYNGYLSDQISLNRSLLDTRHFM